MPEGLSIQMLRRQFNGSFNNLVCDLDQLCMKATAYRKKDMDDIKYLVSILKRQGVNYSMFLERFEFLYGDSVRMTYSAKMGIEHLFKSKRY